MSSSYQIQRLIQALSQPKAGQIYVLETELTAEERLIDYLRQRLNEEGFAIYNYQVTAQKENLSQTLTALLPQTPLKKESKVDQTSDHLTPLIFAHGFHKLGNRKRKQSFHQLNFTQPQFQNIPAPVLLWIPSPYLEELQRLAPNFWAACQNYFQLCGNELDLNELDTTALNLQLSSLKTVLEAIVQDSNLAFWEEHYYPLKAIPWEKANPSNKTQNTPTQTTAVEKSPLRRLAELDYASQSNAIDVLAGLQNQKRSLLLGPAGAGKTTVLQRLTISLAHKGQTALAQNKLVYLSLYLNFQHAHLSTPADLETAILSFLQTHGLPNLKTVADVQALLKGQRPLTLPTAQFIFLIDGPHNLASYKKMIDLVNPFSEAHPQNHFILACREQVHHQTKPEKPAFAETAIFHLQALRGLQIEGFLNVYLASAQSKSLVKEIQRDPQLLDLSQRPQVLMALMQISAQGQEKLHKNRGVVFKALSQVLLKQEQGEGKQAAELLELYQNILADIGLIIQKTQGRPLALAQVNRIILHYLDAHQKNQPRLETHPIPKLGIDAVREDVILSGLLQYHAYSGKTELEFSHYSYQEFFAALALKNHQQTLESHINTPESLRDWYGVVVFLYGLADNQPALFKQIIGSGTDYARIWLSAQCLVQSGQELAVVYEDLQKALPDQNFALNFSLGLASYQIGRYPEALAYLLKAVAVQAGNPEVEYELASLYRQLAQYKRALDHLDQAIRLRPDYVDAYNLLGLTYYNQQNYEEALTVFITVTELEPDNPYHYYNLGNLQKILKNYPSAKEAFAKSITLKPDYERAKRQFERLDEALSSGVLDILGHIPMFGKLSLEQLIVLANRLEVVNYNAGAIIGHLGELNDSFFIVETGTVEILSPYIDYGASTHQKNLVVSHKQANQFFGETALLRTLPRTGTVRCVDKVRLLKLARSVFSEVMQYAPSIPSNLVETAHHRLLSERHQGRRSNLDDLYNPMYLQEVLDKQNEVTVIMGDIHGSTFLTNSVGPEVMAQFLDDYLTLMSNIVVDSGGAMDKSLGDSVMAVFGKFPERVGETDSSAGTRALFAAFQMRQAYKVLRDKWRPQSPAFMETGMGIGISTGNVKIGTVGSEGVMVGAAVNVSSKLSKMAVRGRNESEIYIDQNTHDMLQEMVAVEPLQKEYVLGKSGGVDLNVYQVVGEL